MKSALIISILVKGLGAIFEMGSQVLVTRFGSVELFGEYNFYVSVTEIICWVFFSGIVKCNAYYIATGVGTASFRRRFFLVFALPVTILISLAGLGYSVLFSVAVFGAYCNGLQLNLSSVYLACRRYKVSLFGEYLASRIVILLGVSFLIWWGALDVAGLVLIYILGFIVAICYFIVMRRGLDEPRDNKNAAVNREMMYKQVRFQLTDVANGMINQAPVIVQYLFSGAFHAGVLSVILVTRKVISFIAGPTAKVYLPEFARRYGEGDMEGLRSTYREIVLLQMCFVLPICLVAIGVPDVLLAVYNEQLAAYGDWMRAAAVVFMLMVVFGPQGNLLSMVGREKVEMASKWASLAVMVVVMALTFGDDMFVFYGIAAQVVADALTKLAFLVRALGGFPMGLRDWALLAAPFLALTAVAAWVPLGALERLVVACSIAVILCGILILTFFRDAVRSRLGRVSRNA